MQKMFYHGLIDSHGREPLNYALINEFIKLCFITTVTKHLLVAEPHTLSVKQAHPITRVL